MSYTLFRNDPSRWLIIQYPCGAGGKFLSMALQTIDCIASWNPKVEMGLMSYQDYVLTLWNTQEFTDWLINEPLSHWNTSLNFFSRSMARGENMSVKEFEKLTEYNADEYFKYIWVTDKIILDTYHKALLPKWWEQAQVISIASELDNPSYIDKLSTKLIPYRDGFGYNLLDRPHKDDANQNAQKYNNPWMFKMESKKKWIDWIIKKDSRLNLQINNPTIRNSELKNFEVIHRLIKSTAKHYKSNYNENDLKFLFDYWCNK